MDVKVFRKFAESCFVSEGLRVARLHIGTRAVLSDGGQAQTFFIPNVVRSGGRVLFTGTLGLEVFPTADHGPLLFLHTELTNLRSGIARPFWHSSGEVDEPAISLWVKNVCQLVRCLPSSVSSICAWTQGELECIENFEVFFDPHNERSVRDYKLFMKFHCSEGG